MEFSIKTGAVVNEENNMCKVHQKLGLLINQLRMLSKQLGYQDDSFAVISKKLSQYSESLQKEYNTVYTMSEVLLKCRDYYIKTENSITNYSVGRRFHSIDQDRTKIFTILGLGRETNPSTNLIDIYKIFLDSGKDFLKGLFECTAESDGLKSGNIFNEGISYIESLWGFLTGDKKGLTGASDWCKLGDDTISWWKEAYTLFYDKYSDVGNDLFNSSVREGVAYAGIGASALGLISEMLNASNGLEEKNVANIFADYMKCGNNVVDVISDIYKSTHLNDTNSLFEIKSGVWSAGKLYEAIAKGGVDAVSQGIKSVDKYLSDGKWDAVDTGATGIDISLAGLNVVVHTLTYGMDTFVYSAVDILSGGNGNSDMGYVEKAAEGYKMFAKYIGSKIGNLFD